MTKWAQYFTCEVSHWSAGLRLMQEKATVLVRITNPLKLFFSMGRFPEVTMHRVRVCREIQVLFELNYARFIPGLSSKEECNKLTFEMRHRMAKHTNMK